MLYIAVFFADSALYDTLWVKGKKIVKNKGS